MHWFLLAAVFVAGALQPVQAGMNAEFRKGCDSPFQAAMLNMGLGALAMFAFITITRIGLPPATAFRDAPWWSFGGGLIGATLVTTMLVAAPKLGAATLIVLFFAGQMSASVTIDQFGLVGYPIKPVNPTRLIGLALVLVGTLLVVRK